MIDRSDPASVRRSAGPAPGDSSDPRHAARREDSTGLQDTAGQPGFSAIALRVLRRLPFTTGVVAITLVLGIALGSLWRAAQHRPWYPDVAYGLPPFHEGRFQTLVLGLWFAPRPAGYVGVIAIFAVLTGFAEWRLGTVRTAVLTVSYQFVGVLGAAAFLAIFQNSAWVWAADLSMRVDVGFTTGAIAALAVASATVPPPWRLRLRLGIWAWVLVTVLYVGNVESLQRGIAVLASLPFSTRLAGARGLPTRAMPTRHEMRLLAAVGLLILAVTQALALLLPDRLIPFGGTGGPGAIWYGHLGMIVVALVVANGLRRGYRWAWWAVVVLCLVPLARSVLAALVLFVGGTGSRETRDLRHVVSVLAGGAIVWVVFLIVLVLARDAFTVPRRSQRRRATSASQPELARQLLRRWGGGTVSWMTTWPENRHMVTTDGLSYLAFRRHAGVGIALGDPVGPPGSAAGTIRDFVALCDRTAMIPYLFSCGAGTVRVTEAMGWKAVQVAEDNLIDLPGLAFSGRSWQDVRTALNRAGKQGVTFRMVTLADQPWSLVRQVEQLSEEWLGGKGLPEMGFTLGGVPEALDPAVKVGLAIDAQGTVQGVTSWMPVYAGDDVITGWTLDLMRRRRDGGFRPVMEFLIACSCKYFQEQGAAFVSLSGAPLARSERPERSEHSELTQLPERSEHSELTQLPERSEHSEQQPGGSGPIDRFLDTLGASLEPVYGFRSLHAFKAKFQPRREPIYMAFRDEADLPRIGIGITRAYLPTASVGDLLSVVRH